MLDSIHERLACKRIRDHKVQMASTCCASHRMIQARSPNIQIQSVCPRTGCRCPVGMRMVQLKLLHNKNPQDTYGSIHPMSCQTRFLSPMDSKTLQRNCHQARTKLPCCNRILDHIWSTPPHFEDSVDRHMCRWDTIANPDSSVHHNNIPEDSLEAPIATPMNRNRTLPDIHHIDLPLCDSCRIPAHMGLAVSCPSDNCNLLGKAEQRHQ